MPLYTFKDTNTDEVFEKMMPYTSKVEYLEQNPHIQSVIEAPALIAGISVDSGRLPEGFKDRLRLMKEKQPGAKGLDHLI